MPPIPDPEQVLDLLLDPSWVHRRKDSIELLDEQQLRHRISVDFSVPAGCDAVPLFVLEKARAKFDRFDFVNESGRALPLPVRQDNVDLSAELLEAAAHRVLAGLGKPDWLSPRLKRELRFIATRDSDSALATVKHGWPKPPSEPATDAKAGHATSAAEDSPSAGQAGQNPWPAAPGDSGATATVPTEDLRDDAGTDPVPVVPSPKAKNKAALVADPDFYWLLRTLAHSAVLMVDVTGSSGPRRILKLGYDEELVDLSQPPAPGFFSMLARTTGRFFYRLGWRGYPVKVFLPYAGASTFHLELHLPDGLELLESGLTKRGVPAPGSYQKTRRKSVHHYVADAVEARNVTVFAQTRVRGAGFTGAAVLAPLTIAGALVACWLAADRIDGRELGSAPSLLLLFPGLISTFIARAEHPLVAHLMKFARYALLGSALTAYLGAAALALTNEHTTSSQLQEFFKPLAIASMAIAAVLVATWVLPLPLSHWLRRPFRWLARRPAVARRLQLPEGLGDPDGARP